MTLRDGDTMDAAVAATGLTPGGFDSSPTIPLDAGVPALEGYAAVLEHLAGAIEANWTGTVADVDPEFLHDFRVAVRRTRSVLSQAKHVLSPDVRDRFRTEFKWLADATGEARDLDVYVLEWETYVAPLGSGAAALEPVLDAIADRRRRAHAALARTLRTKRAGKILLRWREELADPQPGRDAQRALGPVVVERITAAQRQVLERGRGIGSTTPGEELHELRKDAKKLRYLLECFGGMLPTSSRKAFVQRLKSLQDNLGAHQDAEVHITQLHGLAQQLEGKGLPAEALLAMGQLVHHLEERRQSSRAEFDERFATYDSKTTRSALRRLLGKVAT
jgi:CHAD domain-containing protein